jgi:hypothetical protein
MYASLESLELGKLRSCAFSGHIFKVERTYISPAQLGYQQKMWMA